MARVQFGALITEITGSIGGFTFQKNSSGNVIRLRPTGKKKQSDKQTAQQAQLTSVLSAWQNLTFVQKQLWNDYAFLYPKTNAYGQTKSVTGLNWFTSINQNLKLISQPQVQEPPLHLLPIAPGTYNFLLTSDTFKIIFVPVFNPTTESLLIRATRPLSSTSQALQKDFRLIHVLNSPPFSEIDLKGIWSNYFNIPYPPSSDGDCYNIAIMVQTCHKISGLTTTGVINLAAVNQTFLGIPYLQIGTTFIIS